MSAENVRRDSSSYGSQNELVQRRGGRGSQDSRGRQQSEMYQPGMPIGYMAARGTPYERKYFTRKLGFCCLFLAPPILLVVGAIALVPVLWAIANHALHTAQLHIYESNITNIKNDSFPITIFGQAKKTGIFPAKLYFRKPVDVYWMTTEEPMRELHLGYFNLAPLGAAAGHATINQLTEFIITDVDGFGEFSKFLVTQPEFTWKTVCDEVHAEGFAFFPVYKQYKFVKHVIFKGIDNFHDIKILDLQLPGDDPEGGITAIATSSLFNPSPFGVQVGTLNLGLYYKEHYVGPVSVNNLNLTTGTNVVTLSGRVLPYQDNQTALDILGELFTNYINGDLSIVEGRGISTTQANGEVISWLTTGLKELKAKIPFVPPEPINPIKGITIDYVSLVYKRELPYNPDLFSNDLKGKLSVPFGFSLNVVDLSTILNIISNGAQIGTVYSPYGNSSTVVYLQTQRETAADITIALPPSQLSLPNTTDAAKKQLIEFQNAFLYSDSASFDSSGSAKAITDTPVGRILLNGIRFKVGTGLTGLSGLTKYPTIINSVDVVGGAPDAISLVVGTTVVNPSNLNLSTGDAVFQLENQVPVGNVTLPGLNLKIGRNDINATSFFDPNRSPKGIEALNRFVSGLDTNLNITGFSGSSEIVSLNPSLQGIRLNATLPGLQQKIVQTANLTVLDSTGITSDIADSHVAAYNPFTAPLTITHISANASSHGIYIANIDTALNFPAAGRAITISPVVPLALNLYPPDLFALVRALAIQSGQNPAYIDGVVQLGGFTLTPTTDQNNGTPAASKRSIEEDESLERRNEEEADSYILEEDNEMAQILMGVGSNPGIYGDHESTFERDDLEEQTDGLAKRAHPLVYDPTLQKRDNLYTGFDLTTYVAKAFAVATADLTIVSDVVIGDYGTTLTFSQNDVPLGTDVTLFKLLPILALPIVQRVVDGAVLNVDRVTITEARPDGFTASLQGALTNAGPFDGVVTFPTGLTIFWEGRALTQTAFPNVTLVGDLGSSINVQVEGQIPDVDYFTQFLQYAIVNPSFVWNIRGQNITVGALGIIIPGVTINKDVQLTGLNGLTGQVIINSFDVPANAPGGLALTAISTINNPAQVGVSLTRFGTNIMMGDTMIGPAGAANPFTLQALAVTQVPLAGTIDRQDSQQGLADLSEVFTRFVHNQNTDLMVMGQYAGPEDVVWLNEGIKALKVKVALPSQDFQVIRLVSINQLSLFFTVPTAYAPMSDTTNTSANFFLPFAFPVGISTVAGPFIAKYLDQDMAVLNIPQSPSTTNVEARILYLAFQNVPFAVYDPAHQTFSQFVADVTRETQITFNLHGSATGTAATNAGDLTIKDIPFDLNTNILGLQNLNSVPAKVANLDVLHGYPTYLDVRITTYLTNPSDISIGAGDVSFGALFTNRVIGTALINDIFLVPGNNSIPTQLLYMPIGAENVRAGQTVLENYVQNITSDAVVAGTSQTTPIDSLKQGLGQISLTAAIPPLDKMIVIQAALVVPKNIAQTGIASASVIIANPFTASINIINLIAQANFQGITIGNINQDLAATNNIIHAPGKQNTQTQEIPININIDPKVLIRFILAAASTYGVDLGPLPPFFQQVLDLPSTATSISPYPDDTPPPCDSGTAFDTLGAVLRLLAPLQTSIPIQSVTKIDDYQTNLNFLQEPVPTKTDNTALYLIGPAGAPLIQLVVNASTLIADRANATRLTNDGFQATILGALKANAPADAYIEFPDPVAIIFQGTQIAEIALPGLCNIHDIGIPNLLTTGQLTITNQDAFTDFSYYLLTQPSFQWTLRSTTVSVRALGIKFSNVFLEKQIQLDAFNGLPGIRITSFDAPSDTDDTINIVTTAAIPSQASLGVELGKATFELFFNGVDLGQASSDGLFLAYKANTSAVLSGFLIRQNSQNGVDQLGILFSQFLGGKDSILSAHGKSVVGPYSGGQEISWLSKAFRRFSTDVVLPGHIYQIIYSIVLSDLTAVVPFPGRDSYQLEASNNKTTAMFANPFGFRLTALEAAPQITITYTGVDAAQINLPLAPVVSSGTSTGQQVPLVINFKNQLLSAIDQGAFRAFLAKLADTESVDFGLKGTTAVKARLSIGDPVITGIPFNVTTDFKGINSFNRVATVSNVTVDDPTPEYIGIHLIAGLFNPTAVNLYTDGLSLPVIYKGPGNPYLGRATTEAVGIFPGQNNIAILFEFVIPSSEPERTQAQEVLTLYLQPTDFITEGSGNSIPLQINGKASTNPPLSPYPSLEDALEGIIADTTLQGIGSAIAKQADIYVPPSALLQTVIAVLTSNIDGLGSVLGGIAGVTGILSGLNRTAQSTNGGSPGDIYVYAYLTAINDIPSALRITHIEGPVYDAEDPTFLLATLDTVDGFQFNLPKAIRTSQPDGQHKSPEVRHIKLETSLLQALGHLHPLNVKITITTGISGPNGEYIIPSVKYEQHNIPANYYLAFGETGEAGLPLNGISGPGELITTILDTPALKPILDPLLSALGLGSLLPSQVNGLPGAVNSVLCSVLKIGNCPTTVSSTSSLSVSVPSADVTGAASTVAGVASSAAAAGSSVASQVTSAVSEAAASATGVVGALTELGNALGGSGGGSGRRRNVAEPAITPEAKRSNGELGEVKERGAEILLALARLAEENMAKRDEALH